MKQQGRACRVSWHSPLCTWCHRTPDLDLSAERVRNVERVAVADLGDSALDGTDGSLGESWGNEDYEDKYHKKQFCQFKPPQNLHNIFWII